MIGKIIGSLFMIGIGSLTFFCVTDPEKMAKLRGKGDFYGEVEPTELNIALTRICGIAALIVSVGLLIKIWFFM